MTIHFSDLSLVKEHYLEAVEHTVRQTSLLFDKMEENRKRELALYERAGLLLERDARAAGLEVPTWQIAKAPLKCLYCGDTTLGFYKGRTPRHAHDCQAMSGFQRTYSMGERDRNGVTNRHWRRRAGVRLTDADNVRRVDLMDAACDMDSADLAHFLFVGRYDGEVRPRDPEY